MPTESPFACDMSAFDPAERGRHIDIIREVFGAVQSVRELPNGYAFRLPNDFLMKAAEFVSNERLCCPFFGFTIQMEPEGGALWLHLTGREGVKPFILAEIGGALDEQVVRAGSGNYTEERRDLLPDWDAATLVRRAKELQKSGTPGD